MLLTVLIVLTVYLLACYAYGAVLLMRRNLQRRSPDAVRDDLQGVVTHHYPSATTTPETSHAVSHATPHKAAA